MSLLSAINNYVFQHHLYQLHFNFHGTVSAVLTHSKRQMQTSIVLIIKITAPTQHTSQNSFPQVKPSITFSRFHVSFLIKVICESQYKISCYIMHLFVILHYSKTREDPGVRSWQNLTVGKSQPLQNLCLLQV